MKAYDLRVLTELAKEPGTLEQIAKRLYPEKDFSPKITHGKAPGARAVSGVLTDLRRAGLAQYELRDGTLVWNVTELGREQTASAQPRT